MTQVRILCVGDMHLGRVPALPAWVLEGLSGGASEVSVRPVWEDVVREAREHRVAAVLLAGDVVDSDDGFLAAYEPLERGVRELVSAGISVIAVSGNHDTEVLPRLADEIPELVLLGRGGEWESRLVEVEGAPVLRVLGWSFPRSSVTNDPLDLLDEGRRRGDHADGLKLPTVGLLHGDLEVPGSRYAPLSRAKLEGAETAGWLLGHQHKPTDLSGSRPIGYLGCLSGNDFGEDGVRGPWLGTLEAGQLRLEQLPLSRLRLEHLKIDVTGVGSGDELERRLIQSVRDLDRARAQAGCAARIVMVRPHLRGRAALRRRDREAVLARSRDEGALYSNGDAQYFLDRKAVDLVQPELDLTSFDGGTDPPAVLAQLILGLEGRTAETQGLVVRARRSLEEEASHKNFTRLDPLEVTDDAARAHLIQSGYRALEELLAQRAPLASEDAE